MTTDLSKAFGLSQSRINHRKKMQTYGFDNTSLLYILSYLTGRKQRTKVNNSFSNWGDIKLGAAAQGSILGPLLFNI